MGFPRQKYQSGLPFPSPGDLLDPEIQLTTPALAKDSLFYVIVAQLCLILCNAMDCSSPGSSPHRILSYTLGYSVIHILFTFLACPLEALSVDSLCTFGISLAIIF